ncbi:MAG: DNA starvation/stationary phase protection protein [Nocardioides sp.]|uniref:Dps family protein n=1 Tax=Nocardioides sp. TaxID=35761 RepID=UPI0039E36C95
MPEKNADKIVSLLQDRLHADNDLQLTLKHIHWNVVGPQFVAVHEMIDPQVDAVRLQADALAERIAALGGIPVGTPGALVKARSWEDYSLGRATTQQHLRALSDVYKGVIDDHRKAMEELEDLDLVTQDLIIGHIQELEQFDWFVRAHLEQPAEAPEGTTVPDDLSSLGEGASSTS